MKRSNQKIKNVVILGSTGSIGDSSLDVIRRNRKRFRVVGLSANQNVQKIQKLIREFSPEAVSMGDTPSAEDLKKRLQSWVNPPVVWNHHDGLQKLASMENANLVISGVVGASGLLPLIAALKSGKTVALANKEALVVGGEIITSLAKKHGATLLPVDSEHSAIFQCLAGSPKKTVERIILTASGGPFYRFKGDLRSISVEKALDHPTWKMGKKITIDSATLMNKGLEAIEAHYLFGIPMEKISIVIHPQSIVHSLVEYSDGAMIAQLSHPDMRLPIQYAMTYPDRWKTPLKKLKLEEIKKLDFDKPDFSRFPCLKLALDAGRRGGTAPAVLSASNEAAVKAFIDKRIGFMEIPKIIKQVLDRHDFKLHPTLNDVLSIDSWARLEAEKFIRNQENKK